MIVKRKLGHLVRQLMDLGRGGAGSQIKSSITEVQKSEANVSDGDPAPRPPSSRSLGEGLLPVPQAGKQDHLVTGRRDREEEHRLQTTAPAWWGGPQSLLP